jgi:hypothetical protein
MYKVIINSKEVIGSYQHLLSLIPVGMLGYKIEKHAE